MMKKGFYFTLKTLLVLNIFNFSLDVFGYVGLPLDKKAHVNFEIHEVIYLETNNYNTDR